jgi:hypothetical protein
MSSQSNEFPRMKPPNLNSMVDFQKMVFIYNAVNDGWTVKILPDERYEFSKVDKRVTSDQCMDGYLKDFIEYYMQLKTTKKNKDNTSNSPSPK